MNWKHVAFTAIANIAGIGYHRRRQPQVLPRYPFIFREVTRFKLKFVPFIYVVHWELPIRLQPATPSKFGPWGVFRGVEPFTIPKASNVATFCFSMALLANGGTGTTTWYLWLKETFCICCDGNVDGTGLQAKGSYGKVIGRCWFSSKNNSANLSWKSRVTNPVLLTYAIFAVKSYRGSRWIGSLTLSWEYILVVKLTVTARCSSGTLIASKELEMPRIVGITGDIFTGSSQGKSTSLTFHIVCNSPRVAPLLDSN